MRMITRKQALEIVDAHGWGPKSCTASHTRQCLNGLVMQGNDSCDSFDSSLGLHDQYAIIDVKNWLGY